MSDQIPQTSVQTSTGATVQSYYARRNMTIYPVAEHELDSLTTMNMLNTALFSIGVGLISLAVGVAANWAFAEKVTPAGEVLTKFVAPLLTVFGIVAFSLCKWTTAKRNAIWNKIVQESKSGLS